MNTENELNDSEPPSPDRALFVAQVGETDKSLVALVNNIAKLETDLDSEKEERKEEKFYYICVMFMLGDIIAIDAIDGSWLFILVFMLQLIVLLGLAKKWGVDWAVKLIGWFLHWIAGKVGLN